MEELREAALGYYNNNPQIQEPAREFFRRLDINSDGRISLTEFLDFFSRQTGYAWIQDQASFFHHLDRDGDGSLDFWEVITFYYIIKTRTVLCRSCLTNLFGLYFTCTTCFDHSVESYDLCLSCYGSRDFYHDHDRFLDSYVLLRTRTGAAAVAAAANNDLIADHNEYNGSLALALYNGQPQPQNQQPAFPVYHQPYDGSRALALYNGPPQNQQPAFPVYHQPPNYIAHANPPNQLQVQPRGRFGHFIYAVHFMDAAMIVVPWLAPLCTIM